MVSKAALLFLAGAAFIVLGKPVRAQSYVFDFDTTAVGDYTTLAYTVPAYKNVAAKSLTGTFSVAGSTGFSVLANSTSSQTLGNVPFSGNALSYSGGSPLTLTISFDATVYDFSCDFLTLPGLDASQSLLLTANGKTFTYTPSGGAVGTAGFEQGHASIVDLAGISSLTVSLTGANTNPQFVIDNLVTSGALVQNVSVPEPTVLAVLTAGLLSGAGLLRRRRG